MNLKNGLIIVTGSSGLIGTKIINRLAKDFKIVGLDREGPPYPPPSADCLPIDLSSDESVEKAFHEISTRYGKKIISVIHLAAYYNFSGENSPLYDSVTVKGTERLLNALQSFDVEQFIFSSTMLVHKPSEPGKKINESSPMEAKWPYPQSKVKTEKIIKQKHGKIPFILARIAGVYNDECQSIPLANQIKRIYENDITSRVFPGNPEHGQSFIHLDDLVDALEKMVWKRGELSAESIFLIGEPMTVGYGELQETFCRLLHGEPCKVHQIPKIVAKVGAAVQLILPGGEKQFIKPWMIDLADDHYELDIDRAKRFLNWEPKHMVSKSTSKMIHALKKDPLKWYKEHNLPTAAIEKN